MHQACFVVSCEEMCSPLILDELIRQITIECAERGLLLLRYDLRSPTYTCITHFAMYYTLKLQGHVRHFT